MEKLISVRDVNRSFEAHNLNEDVLVEAVRPWFTDIQGEDVKNALDSLAKPAKRQEAMRFLGVEYIR
ncbi:hypothetical protein KRX54_04235 [Actinomycetaceae bacterium TAE3-ERU4]|nr:hypothetical protein [Actinomycetaceae bacterium TAE3-ERU4]